MPIRKTFGRVLGVAAAALLLVVPSNAYYHYIHYVGRNAPFTPLYEKFDLNALAAANRTVSFFVSDQSPTTYAANDSWGSVLSQVKQAIAVWNAVPTSDLRVAFGGLEGQYQPVPTTPSGDVVFTDLPPGVLGLGGPTSVQTPVNGFFPIVRSTVYLSRDTNRGAGASYLEEFFTTAVHEIGHSLGLQHTWTGSAMSQGVVRNTSRTRPLDADDIAGLSVLYGKSGWTANYGSISGRITFTNGQPVAMASVVAIAPTGPAVSALTDPNGNYRIDGLPPNYNYMVYVHPLPPDGVIAGGEGIRVPVDQNGQPFQPTSSAFQTIFYQGNLGTLNPQQALQYSINGGSAVTNVDFTVQQRGSVPTYDVVTYYNLDTATRSYVSASTPTTITGYPAFVNSTQSPALVTAGALAPAFLPNPQSMTILGGFVPAILNSPTWPTIWPVTNNPGWVWAFFGMPLGAGTGPRHLVFNFGNDLYVLPNGVNLVQKGPPRINSAIPNPDGSVVVTGAGFGPDSSVYFDGLKASVTVPFSGSDSQGSITVLPPQGASGQTATITVYNTDSQNSMILQMQNPQTYPYPVTTQPQITDISQNFLPAGSSAAITITTSNTNFVDGQVTVGFGSADVTVRRVWVKDATHLLANVSVSPGAATGFTELSIVSGFQVITFPGGFRIQQPTAGLPFVALPIVNADPTQQTIYPGAIATIYGSNLALSPTSPVIKLNDTPLQLQAGGVLPGQINFYIPFGFPTGLATLKLNNGSTDAYPVMLQIDNQPPTITQVTNQSNVVLSGLSGAALGAASPVASPGEVLSVYVNGLDASVVTSTSRVQVTVAGVQMPVQPVIQAVNGQYQIQFILTQSFGATQVPVVVWVDGSSSAPVTIAVR